MTNDEMMNAILRSRIAMNDPSVANYAMAQGILKVIKRVMRKHN